MSWIVEISEEFESEFDALHEEVQTEILALTRLLQQFGPHLGQPRVDTLNDSRHANMKEFRFSAGGGESHSPLIRSERGSYSSLGINRG